MTDAQRIERVEKAIREGKVFEIRGEGLSGSENCRQFLLSRGWVEKPRYYRPPLKYQQSNINQSQTPNQNQSQTQQGQLVSNPSQQGQIQQNLIQQGPIQQNYANSGAQLLRIQLQQQLAVEEETADQKIARLLHNTPAYLIWVDWAGDLRWSDRKEFQMVFGGHPQDEYLLKKNLLDVIEDMQWIASQRNTNITAFPRTYRLYLDDEREAFIQDYRLTTCMSILRWFIIVAERDQKDGAVDEAASSMLFPLLDFSIIQCRHYIRIRSHGDIDDIDDYSRRVDFDWEKIYTQVYRFVHRRVKLKITPVEGVTVMYKKAINVFIDLQRYWPQARIDGVRNIWILKPGQFNRKPESSVFAVTYKT